MQAQPKPVAAGVNFGDLSFYAGGFLIPPGKYALEFGVQMFQATNQQGVAQGPPRLGVLLKAHSLTQEAERGENAHTQFYSMGTNADKSFAPNPDTGKGLIAVPGGPATTLPQSSNWGIFLKSLYDAGLPNGVFTNDLSVLDGIHVAMTQIDEPEERKGFASATAEVAQLSNKGPKKIAVVAEILPDGAPWEGKGGVPAAGAAASQAAAAKAARKSGAAAAHAPTPAAPTPAPVSNIASPDEGDVLTAAVTAAADVLGASPKGMKTVVFKTLVFPKVKAGFGDATAQAVQNAFMASHDTLNGLLNQLGYKLAGVNNIDVVPA